VKARTALVVLVLTTLTLFGRADRAEAVDNLLFVALPPCRVVNTNLAGGILVAGVPRTFLFRGANQSYSSQGGSASGCGIPGLAQAGGNFHNVARAVAVNIVAVQPAGQGNMKAWPSNLGEPLASTINYNAIGTNLANGVILPMCSAETPSPCGAGDITFKASFANVHLVVDVVGYFHAGSPSEARATDVALGRNALLAPSVPGGNTAVGYEALQDVGTGTSNVGVGFRALTNTTAGGSNNAVGTNALAANTTGNWNNAVGRGALTANVGGNGNNALGDLALSSNTQGNSNVAVGDNALRDNVNGNDNTALGANALLNDESGDDNVAVGAHAAETLRSGFANTAVGADALRLDDSGSGNTAVGFKALESTTIGGATAVGRQALRANTTGLANVALGDRALQANTVGGANTAIGSQALEANIGGAGNVAIGTTALADHDSSAGNVAIGASALSSLISGNNNVVIGMGAAGTTLQASHNVVIGANAGSNLGGANNILVSNAGVDDESNAIRIGSSHLYTYIAGIRGTQTFGNDRLPVVIDEFGQLGTGSSSARTKQDVAPIGEESAVLAALRPVSFRYRQQGTGDGARREFGLIAEEVAAVFPELAVFDRDGQPTNVRYHLLVPLLLNELQRLQAAHQQLQGEHDRLVAAHGDLATALAPLREELRLLRVVVEGGESGRGVMAPVAKRGSDSTAEAP
jgi:hypothetical protein